MTSPEFIDWRDTLAELFPPTSIEPGFEFDISAAVYRAYEVGAVRPLTIRLRGGSDSPRRYLGASSIGGECVRKTWAQWRGLGDGFGGRLLRLFRTGDVYEERMRAELVAVGFDMYGDQARFEAFSGDVAGHTDGCAQIAHLPPAQWEAKTANHRRFTELLKLRRAHDASTALMIWDRKYWGQAHAYMAAFGLHVCLYSVTDKNTDQLQTFIFERDDEAVADAGERARQILRAREVAPPRAYARPKTPECSRFCDFAEWCWYEGEMPVRCGSCRHWHNGICMRDGSPATAVCDRYQAVGVAREEKYSEWESL